MKKSKLALAALLAVSAVPSFAQSAPASDWTITGNVGVFSDYRFRGISQTNKKPALQGGFDVAHSSGLYIGNWNSNIDSVAYTGANIEMDFYGGYKFNLGDVALDAGVLYYYYPGSGNTTAYPGSFKVDNTELYLGATLGPVTLKYSHAVGDFFGAPNSKNSYYLDASAAYDLGNGFGLVGHVGYQKLKGGARVTEIGATTPVDNIVDYKLGATYTFSNGFVLGASYISTNRDLAGGTAGKNISNGTALLSLSKTF